MWISDSINRFFYHSPKSDLLAADLLGHIAKCKPSENVVFSPISIQAALAMIYLGAAGKTAKELRNGLYMSSSNKAKIDKHFVKILAKKDGQAECIIANRVFVSSDYQLQTAFNNRSEKYFKSGVKTVNFKDMSAEETVEIINSWVENNTNKKITNCIKPGAVGQEAVAVIVNAICFEGKWSQPFCKDMTRKRAFWNSYTEFVIVDFMTLSYMNLKYGEFPALNATAIEMPYDGSDLAMMLILPSGRVGLADLESKLSSTSINRMSSEMNIVDINELMVPKFSIEFSTELPGVLKEMGIQSVFENADLPGIFQSRTNIKISNVLHKASIVVNEAGSEANAASVSVPTDVRNLENPSHTSFKADHPFVFAIKDSKTIYFIGHVSQL